MNPIILSLALAVGADSKPYPRAELLIDAAALADRTKAGKLVLLDVRSDKAYREGHIPGAVAVSATEWSQAFNSEKEAAAWSRRLGALGIKPAESTVVVYGDDWRESARVWWILRAWGVEDARLLNGGWGAWKAANGKVSTGAESARPVDATARHSDARLATKDQVLKVVQDKSKQILDVRTMAEHCGTKGPGKRIGAIPGSIHLEWSRFVDEKSQMMKPSSEIEKLLREAGVDLSKPVVTYCQSGGRAAVAAFVLELMGGVEVRNYYRSWAEWGNDSETPIVKPEKK